MPVTIIRAEQAERAYQRIQSAGSRGEPLREHTAFIVTRPAPRPLIGDPAEQWGVISLDERTLVVGALSAVGEVLDVIHGCAKSLARARPEPLPVLQSFRSGAEALIQILSNRAATQNRDDARQVPGDRYVACMRFHEAHPVLYRDGQVTDLTTLGIAGAIAINNRGRVPGSGPAGEPLVYGDGGVTLPAIFADRFVTYADLNDAGVAIGTGHVAAVGPRRDPTPPSPPRRESAHLLRIVA